MLLLLVAAHVAAAGYGDGKYASIARQEGVVEEYASDVQCIYGKSTSKFKRVLRKHVEFTILKLIALVGTTLVGGCICYIFPSLPAFAFFICGGGHRVRRDEHVVGDVGVLRPGGSVRRGRKRQPLGAGAVRDAVRPKQGALGGDMKRFKGPSKNMRFVLRKLEALPLGSQHGTVFSSPETMMPPHLLCRRVRYRCLFKWFN